jgi:hypothetical protein
MSYYDVVGYDTFVGAGRGLARRLARRGARQQGRQQRPRRNQGPPQTEGTHLRQTTQRVRPFGLGAGSALASGVELVLSAVVQNPMQPIGFVVQSDSIEDLEITGLSIGTTSQLAGVARVPASFYRSDGTQNAASFSPALPGQTIEMRVVNTDASAAHRVAASFRCVVANAA